MYELETRFETFNFAKSVLLMVSLQVTKKKMYTPTSQKYLTKKILITYSDILQQNNRAEREKIIKKN